MQLRFEDVQAEVEAALGLFVVSRVMPKASTNFSIRRIDTPSR